MSEVRFNLNGIKALVKEMPKFLDTVERKIAKKAPGEIVSNIEKGLTGIYPFGILPQNKPSTIRAKLARGNRSKPLQDELELTEVGDWTARKVNNGWTINPPSSRGSVVGYLSQRTENRPAYQILKMPTKFFPVFARTILNTNFFAFIRKHS